MRILLILSACLVLSCTATEDIDGVPGVPVVAEIDAAPRDESTTGEVLPLDVEDECLEVCGDDCCVADAPYCCDGTDTFICQPDPC